MSIIALSFRISLSPIKYFIIVTYIVPATKKNKKKEERLPGLVVPLFFTVLKLPGNTTGLHLLIKFKKNYNHSVSGISNKITVNRQYRTV